MRSHRTQAHSPCTHCCLSSCPPGSLVTSVQEMQTVCIVVSGICFLSFENFPGLREDRLEPISCRDFGGCRSYDGEADGAPKSWSQLILLLRFLFAWGGGRGWAKFPMPGTPFPPSSPGELLLVLQDPAQAATSSRKPTLISQAVCPFFHCASMSCASLSSSQRPACVCGCHLSLSPPADCELLEGKGPMSCACLCPAHPQMSVETVGGWD